MKKCPNCGSRKIIFAYVDNSYVCKRCKSEFPGGVVTKEEQEARLKEYEKTDEEIDELVKMYKPCNYTYFKVKEHKDENVK